jgi:hypothetical protein
LYWHLTAEAAETTRHLSPAIGNGETKNREAGIFGFAQTWHLWYTRQAKLEAIERKPLDLLHRAALALMSQAGSSPAGSAATPPLWQDRKEAVPQQLP